MHIGPHIGPHFFSWITDTSSLSEYLLIEIEPNLI